GRFEVEDSPEEIPDLVAEVLAYAVELRLRRRLSVGFYNRHAIVNRVRGRIDVLTTERRQLLHRGMVACRFNELTINTQRNRFVRHALETVSRIVSKNKIAHRCRSLAGRLEGMGVIGLPPTRAQMNMDCCGRNDSDDQQMVAAAKLAFDLALPTERDGSQL